MSTPRLARYSLTLGQSTTDRRHHAGPYDSYDEAATARAALFRAHPWADWALIREKPDLRRASFAKEIARLRSIGYQP